MARRKRFGSPIEVHAERSKSTLREMKRLMSAVKSRLKSPPDCATASRLVIALAQQQGAYLIDRDSYRGRAGLGGKGPRAVIEKFISACVVKPRSKAAERKIHSVWR